MSIFNLDNYEGAESISLDTDNKKSPQFVVEGLPIACPWPWVADVGIQMIIINPVYYQNWIGCPGGGEFGSVPANNAICPWVFKTNLLEETLTELKENRVTFSTLETLNDIDTFEDLIASKFYQSNLELQKKLKQLHD